MGEIGDQMIKRTRWRAVIFLLVLTVIIIALIVNNSKPVSEYMQTGIRLSDLPENECVEYIVSKGVEMPLYYDKSPYFAGVPKELIICYEKDPYKVISGTLGAVDMNNYVEDVRRVVNNYYGVYDVAYMPRIPTD